MKSIILFILLLSFLLFGCTEPIPPLDDPINEKFCETDSDCACGTHKETGECFFGYKVFVDTSKQCPDFCTGITGTFRIKCEENKCISYSIEDNSVPKTEEELVQEVFSKNLSAMQSCDIELHNSLVTKESLEILHPTCTNLAGEEKCHIGKETKVKVKGDKAVLFFPPFNHKEGWPFFFEKEDGNWKIDYTKMAFGISMMGSGCDTGWGWITQEIKDEFCSFFEEEVCPET